MDQNIDNYVKMIEHCQAYLRVSSIFNGNCVPFVCLLNQNNLRSETCWSAGALDKNQFIIASSQIPREWVAVATQGKYNNEWVTSYKIRYSVDNVVWQDYNGGQILNGNRDKSSVVTNFFDKPIYARSIALHPETWQTYISMRLEFYAKTNESTITPPQKKETLTQIGQVEAGLDTKLNEGSGYREVVIPVKFAEKFPSPPKVSICFDLIDTTSSDKRVKVAVQPKDITDTGFNCVFNTWDDAKIFNLRGDYVATVAVN